MKENRIKELNLIEETSGIYDEFTTWVSCKWSGILRGTKIEDIPQT